MQLSSNFHLRDSTHEYTKRVNLPNSSVADNFLTLVAAIALAFFGI